MFNLNLAYIATDNNNDKLLWFPAGKEPEHAHVLFPLLFIHVFPRELGGQENGVPLQPRAVILNRLRKAVVGAERGAWRQTSLSVLSQTSLSVLSDTSSGLPRPG